MLPHTVSRNIFPPVIRKFPSEMFVSTNLFYFSKIKQINNLVKPNDLALNYYVRKQTYMGVPYALDYCSILDITHIDYSFIFKPLAYDSIRNEYIFPTKVQVEQIKKEFDHMLEYFKMENNYHYFLIDENVYINFTSTNSN